MEESVRYWMELSDYDLEPADAMLQTGRYLYVGFMCHQAVEKLFKGFYRQETDKIPPKTHNLRLLARESEIVGKLSLAQRELLALLDPLNMEARYPEHKERISSLMTADRCTELLGDTRRLHGWIKKQLY